MKTSIKSLLTFAAIAIVACSVSSCSEKYEDQFVNNQESESGVKTCDMTFNGGVVGFDNGDGTTRAATSDWSNGDKIYLIFYNGTTQVPGIATYSSSQGWNVSYDGDLANGTGLKCEARYFVNATFSNESLVSINSNTEIYEATNGSYEYNGSTLTVQASMSPKTGRIRFNGKSGDQIHLTGISVYTTYSPALNTFSSTKSMITTTVATNGYTPYIYGTLAYSNKKLGVVGSDFAYTRTCTDAVLKVGDSGYMAIPSETLHNNWRSGLYVTVGDVEFKMVPVAGLSSGFFLIGETEVTRGLYYEVTGNTTTSNLNYPITSIQYNTFQSFITELNYQTDLTFSLPTESQWKYAAKGGKMSQGYTYSGSNNPGDVAWYEGNASSVNAVRQLAPNELGIYDMSGNVAEFTSTNSGGTDLSGSSYSRNRYYGGYYSCAASDVTVASYGSLSNIDVYYSALPYVGYRLKLTCK